MAFADAAGPPPPWAGEPSRVEPAPASGPTPDVEARDGEPDPHDIARQIVLRQLTGSPKSRHQLEQALAKRGCDEQVAARVLDRFAELGLVDDAAYADMLIRSQQVGRGLARRALAHELRAKGVDDDVAEGALETIDEADEEQRARDLVTRRLRRLHGLDRQVQMRRLAGMLARKGYPGDLAMRVVREELDASPQHARD